MTANIQPVELDADDAAAIREATAAVDQDAIVVRPHKDNTGIAGMDDVLTSLPRASGSESSGGGLFSRGMPTPPSFAFEMRYAAPSGDEPTAGHQDERVLSLQYVGGDQRMSDLLGRQLPDKYPDSRTETRPATWLDPDPGQHLAACTLALRRYTLYPVKNVDLDEFRADPTGSILTEMVGAAEAGGVDADVAVQIQCRPAGTDWQQGVSGGGGVAGSYGDGLSAQEDKVTNPLSTQKLRYLLTQSTHERRAILPTPVGSLLGFFFRPFRDEFEHPPSKADKAAATMLSDLDGRGWEFAIRIVAISDDPGLARERVASTAEMFDNFYEYRGAQTFVPVPKTGADALKTARAAAAREWPDDPVQRMIKPQIEVAGLVNIPEADHVSTNKLRWTLASPGEGIPPGTPRFDYDAAGVDPTTESREVVQTAMIDTADADAPLWYGTGVKYGTEAGVFPDTLYHQFFGGATRQGKTTLMSNFVAQRFRAPGAGLIIDPKGMDIEEFIAEWPRDRPVEDLVVVDLSDQYDRVPRFNFMEIPEYLEPGTRAHTSYCEALAEDILAMVAEAGGSDKYMGALMKRVVKTVVRGLAKADRTATLLDVAAVCASSENIARFRDRMDAERFQFLRETADRLESRDDTDLEPLAGRMDEWVLNDNVRELICARDSSFSINDLVKDGRWLAVRFDKASSQTELMMVGTALIRRTYFAQRHLTPDHMFDLVCDEFDNIASTESNIHHLLSEAAAFGYRCTLACQAPTNQLPERVRNAIENQCGTFISFNPGGGTDARWIAHQHSVDAEELLDLPRYRFYMRATTRTDDLTHSYMVRGFPPAREAREDARSDAEIRALTEQSLDLYGATVESEAEQRAASPYLNGPTAGAGAGDGDMGVVANGAAGGDDGGLSLDEYRSDILATVFGATVRSETDPETAAVIDPLRRRLDVAPQNVDTLIQRANARGLVDVDPVAETITLTADGREVLFDSGESGNAGGITHQAAMEPIARALDELGYDVTVPRQNGEELPDLRATPPVEAGGETFAEARAARDTLAEEYPDVWDLTEDHPVAVEYESQTLSAPAQVGHNLRKGLSEGSVVLFVVAAGTGDDAVPVNAERLAAILDDPCLTCAPAATPNDVAARYYHMDEPCQAEADPEDGVVTGSGTGWRVALPDTGRTYQWVRDGGLVTLRDADGTEHAHFADRAAWADRGPTDFPVVYRSRPGEEVEVRGVDGTLSAVATLADLRETHTLVSSPYLPTVEFDGAPSVRLGSDYEIAILGAAEDAEGRPTLSRYDPDTGRWSSLVSSGVQAGDSGSQTGDSGGAGKEEQTADGTAADGDLWRPMFGDE